MNVKEIWELETKKIMITFSLSLMEKYKNCRPAEKYMSPLRVELNNIPNLFWKWHQESILIIYKTVNATPFIKTCYQQNPFNWEEHIWFIPFNNIMWPTLICSFIKIMIGCLGIRIPSKYFYRLIKTVLLKHIWGIASFTFRVT